ncbi:hypothetical protein SAMN05444422_109166 [Halobiforma haloterrestris]|uniref:Uncharacterized protein n=1 Tax=Natronobacterium haloterrestre TaxID=148448 RepID=A0A1I1JXU3_NATHA|nr:hypothetical protein [Halobiforma haloterrestris]SFC51298.1 hypothetical protein SAMN05444422_109166 [Halobiforma haloterrestris]
MRTVANGLLALIAVVALGVAGVLSIRPSVLPPDLLDAIVMVEETVEPDDVLIRIAGLVGLFALWRTYFSGATDLQDGGVDRNAGSQAAASDTNVVGEVASERVERTIESLKRGSRTDRETEAVVDDLRETLRTVETAKGRSDEVAAERIRAGDWTDDRIAAAFLGDASAGRLSIWHRLRMWLFPGQTFEQRLERTLAELERYATDSTSDMTQDTDGTEAEDE